MTAERMRSQKIADLGLQYPLWLFSVDEYAYPWRLTGILHRAQPAQLWGWCPWNWEYGTTLYRIDDPLPLGVVENTANVAGAVSVDTVLKRLWFDDAFDKGSLDLVLMEGSDERLVPLSQYSLKKGDSGWFDPRKIQRIRRRWDDVVVWDKTNSRTAFGRNKVCAFGIAILVGNDGELVEASGVDPTSRGDSIRKAEMEVLGDDPGTQRGIVFPNRYHDHRDGRGIIAVAGADAECNRIAVAGTILDGRPWEEIEEFARGRRNGPLLSTRVASHDGGG